MLRNGKTEKQKFRAKKEPVSVAATPTASPGVTPTADPSGKNKKPGDKSKAAKAAAFPDTPAAPVPKPPAKAMIVVRGSLKSGNFR